MKLKVLVTGCNGNAGTTMCRILKEFDTDVMGIDLKDTNISFVDTFHKGDYSSSYAECIIREFSPSIVVHCAMFSCLKSSQLFHHNSSKFVDFLDSLKGTDVRHIIYLGSEHNEDVLDTNYINKMYLSSYSKENSVSNTFIQLEREVKSENIAAVIEIIKTNI